MVKTISNERKTYRGHVYEIRLDGDVTSVGGYNHAYGISVRVDGEYLRGEALVPFLGQSSPMQAFGQKRREYRKEAKRVIKAILRGN